MGRTNKKKEPPVKPVQRIELKDDKNNKKRIILVVLLLAIGMIGIGYGLFNLLQSEAGWQQIEANNTEEMNCSEEFVFVYNIGQGDLSATVEYKAIANLYSDATVDAYQLFTADEGFDGVNNLFYINHHPNEEVEVDSALYQAFELIQSYQNRNMYLAPIYEQYDDMFYCQDDSEIVDYDPFTNDEVAAYYLEVATYGNSVEAVNLQLLGENKVKLYVSEDYLNYAEENEIDRFIDFCWMKNAFVTDYLADIMLENGYQLGTISSYDGFSRVFSDSDEPYALNLYDDKDGQLFQAGIMKYKGQKSIVTLRDFMINSLDRNRYYELSNGEVRTSYLDMEDGTCKSATNVLTSYSAQMKCAEVMLNMSPIYITDELEEQRVVDLCDKNIYSIYYKDDVIYYNDSMITFSDLNYTTSMMEE